MPMFDWPASVWVGAAMAPIAGYLLYGFIKANHERAAIAIVAAAMVHVAFALLVPIPPPAQEGPPALMEIELLEPAAARAEPATAPEPKPEIEPDVPDPETPEAAKELNKDPPKPRKKRLERAKKPTQDAAKTPPGPKRFDASQLNPNGTSGINVRSGPGGGSTLQGDPLNRGSGRDAPKRAGNGKGAGPGSPTGDGKAWAPASQVFIQKLPVPTSVPKRDCPAAKTGVLGSIFLKVQVRRDGSVRRVRLVKGIGHGCDKVAIRALKQAKFKPATSSANTPVDFEIRYEYVFAKDG